MLNIHQELAYRLEACALILFSKKGGADMMAMLWAQQIMLGKKLFSHVPAKLREQVAELLRDSGCEEMITEE